MMGFTRSDDYQPLMWVRGYPVHAAVFLVVLHCVALIVCCVLQACNVPPAFLGIPGFVPLLGFSADAAWHGAVWQFFTYGFCHQAAGALWFLLDMFFLYIWGREVERYFGRKVFMLLYAALWATTPVLLSTFSAITRHNTAFYEGSILIDFGIFIAFVTIYPNVQFFFGILAKWVAIAMLAIGTLQYFAGNDYSALLVLWGTVFVAFFGTRYASVGSDFSMLGSIRERLPQRTVPSGVKPRMKPRRALDTRTESAGDVHESIDPLLEKISRHGLASLTNGERATLEKARVSLLRKERGA